MQELKAARLKVEEAETIPAAHRPDPRAAGIGAWVQAEEAVLLPRRLEWGEKVYVVASARLIHSMQKKIPPPVGLALLFSGLREALRNPPPPVQVS